MFCANCGKQIQNDSVFCSFCGKSTEEDNSTLMGTAGLKEVPQNRESTDTISVFDQNTTNTESPAQEDIEDVYKYLLIAANMGANKIILKGFIFIGLGLGVTFITWFFASEGGTYYVFWGLVIYGGWVVLKGLYYKLNPKALINKMLGEQEEKK